MDRVSITVSVLVASVLVAAIYDLKDRRIPNLLNVGLTAYGLLLHLVVAGWKGLLFSLAGLALGLALMLIPYVLKGMGAGDVKFMAAVGSVVGARAIVMVFALASLIGAVFSVLALFRWRNVKQVAEMRMAPIDHPPSAIRHPHLEGPVTIPYGVAISLSVLSLTGFWML